MSVSSIGYAKSDDGLNFSARRQFIKPQYDWEKFGCEDPRITKLDGKYFIFYTALSNYPYTPEGIKVGLATSLDLEKIEEKHPVTPFNAKAMALFPERIGGKIAAILTANTDKPPSKICIAMFDSTDQIWSFSNWDKWYKSLDYHVVPLCRLDADQVEVGAPPVKTDHGWLIVYSYISNYSYSGCC